MKLQMSLCLDKVVLTMKYDLDSNFAHFFIKRAVNFLHVLKMCTMFYCGFILYFFQTVLSTV